MGFGNFGSNDSSTEEENNDPSVSYIYVYEQGREELENLDNYAEDAYAVASGGGVLRNFFNNHSPFANIHEGMSHFLVGLAEAVEDGNFSTVLDFLLAPDNPDNDEEVQYYTDALCKWLDEQDEVREELIDRMQSIEDAQPAEADD